MKTREKAPIKDKGTKAKVYGDREDAAENKQVPRKKIFPAKDESTNVSKKTGKRAGFQETAESIAKNQRIRAQRKQGMY